MVRLLRDDRDDEVEFTQDQLASAFDRVRDRRDWKAPIRAEIAACDRAVVEVAVVAFTATVPLFDLVEGHPDRLTVTASGYRAGPWGVTAAAGQGGSRSADPMLAHQQAALSVSTRRRLPRWHEWAALQGERP